MNKRVRLREKNPRWKGGRVTMRNYHLELLPEDDFFMPMARKDGYVLEHRLVMAKHLNRCLLPWEIVHHKNGVKTDNRLENLELLPSRKHHLVDSYIKSYVALLEKRVEYLEGVLLDSGVAY